MLWVEMWIVLLEFSELNSNNLELGKRDQDSTHKISNTVLVLSSSRKITT